MRKLLLLLLASMTLSNVFAQLSEADVAGAKQVVAKNITSIGITPDDINNSIVSSTYTGTSGIKMVYLLQSYKNLPVYNQIFVLAFRGEKLVSAAGGRIPQVEKRVNNQTGIPTLTASHAVSIALEDNKLVPDQPIEIQRTNGNKLNFGKLGVAEEDVTAELLWMPLDNGEIRLAWQVLAISNRTPDAWLTSVDAATGDVIHKVNLTVFDHFGPIHHSADQKPATIVHPLEYVAKKDYDFVPKQYLPFVVDNATYKVVKYPAESPIHPGGTPQDHVNPWTLAPGNATTLGWHNDGTIIHDSTRGNNVWAAEDRLNTDGGSTPNNLWGRAAISTTPQPNLNFPYLYDFTKAPTDITSDNEKAAITNLFYYNNILHDITYVYGFDEVSGNFQMTNLGRGGLGNDAVKAQAQDGGGTNNANFLTPTDGVRGRMQMYIWTAANPDRDGDMDNSIIAHEFGHGVSNRLTGGPAATGCVSNGEHGGEGWSDYIALMTTTNWATATIGDGVLPRGIANYSANQPLTNGGIRVFPYSTNMAINPRVYSATLPSAPHDRGEYWCMALWEMTWEMIQLDGINPNLFNPAATGGNSAAFKLVIEGMKLQPCGPGFIDARNAILKADTLFFANRYSCAIWKAFAKRGMGRLASQGSANSVTDQVPSFIVDNGNLSLNPSATQVPEGQNIVYTNNVTAGDCTPMSNFFLTDTLPTNVTWISGGSYNAGNRTVTSGPVNLTTLQSQAFPFTVSINAGTYFAPVTHFDEQVTGATIPAAWTINPASGNTWTVSTTSGFSPPNSFFAPNLEVVTDMQIRNTGSFTLNPNTVSNFSTLSFWHRFNTEEGWDGGVVEVSTNGGGSWTDLGSRMIRGKYNSSLGTGSALANRQAFTGLQSTFMQTIVNLSSFAGQSVMIRFRFASDNNTAPTGGGWWVDNIVLTTEPAVYMKANLFNSSNQLQNTADTVVKILAPVAGCTPIAITGHPANAGACVGGSTSFSVTATGTAPAYQWQVNTGSGFNNIPVGAPYGGTTSATLSITGVTLAMNNYQYRCVISNACTSPTNSNAAVLTVGQTASIQSHPASATVCAGNNASFAVTVTNAGSYQWQVNTGSGFVDIPAGAPYSGINTANLDITGVTAGMNNYQYRVVIGSCPSSINSNAATLTVQSPVTITGQPNSANVCVGANANFTVTATGTITGYQWQVNTGSGFANIPAGAPYSGTTGATLTITGVILSMNNYQYRCVISASCGSVTSNAATMTVNTSPVFTIGPNPNSVCVSDSAFTLNASVAGGTWSGTGIQGNKFNPGLAGTGTFTITYTVTNAAGCSTALSTQVQVNECAERHITLEKPGAIIVYTIPSDGHFNVWIKTDLYSRLSLRVYNSTGQLLRTKELTGLYYNKKEPLDLSSLPSGTYRLYFYSLTNGVLVKRTIPVVIQR